MFDYQIIIAELKPTPEQIQEATKYALTMITQEVRETHPDAEVIIEEGLIHIISEDHSDDLIFPIQYSFHTFFANKIQEIQSGSHTTE